MLRELKDASVARSNLTLLGWRWRLFQGSNAGMVQWSTSAVRQMGVEQRETPVALFTDERRAYWWFEDRFYWEDESLSAHDVLALVRDRQRRALRKLERARAGLAQDSEVAPARRAPIPRAVRQTVFERDGGACVNCGSSFEIQFDHVIPFSLGGASTVENLQVLCSGCNRAKGAALG